MQNSLKNIQGLSTEISSSLFWVGQSYRTNELSLTPGGTNVIVHYRNGEVLGYNRIKYPSKYIDAILSRRVFGNGTKLSEIPSEAAVEFISNEVVAIYALKYEDVDKGCEEYKEVWNCDSTQMPWDKMDDYMEDDYSFDNHNYERDAFYALTDGQYGDYQDWAGDMDHLMDSLGF